MSGYVGGYQSPYNDSLHARLKRDETEVLVALTKEPLSTEELVMVCNMGKHGVWVHLQNLLAAGKIERETAMSNYGGRPHEVRTGRYRAVAQMDSQDMECTELLAVSA